jgi:hypothetical protein
VNEERNGKIRFKNEFEWKTKQKLKRKCWNRNKNDAVDFINWNTKVAEEKALVLFIFSEESRRKSVTAQSGSPQCPAAIK